MSPRPPSRPSTRRGAFQGGDYADALAQTGRALAKLPTDATSALCLFTLRRYDEAAATLYAVLSAGPGWDWTTLVGLNPNVDVYTQQLRDLEADVRQNPSKAQARFVLAYHYLTMGSNDAAVSQYRAILNLQSGDTLFAQLLQRLSGEAIPQPATAAVEPAAAPAGQLEGNWAAEPTRDVSITPMLGPDRTFTWTVTDRGKRHVLAGRYESDSGGTDDPGLTFHK